MTDPDSGASGVRVDRRTFLKASGTAAAALGIGGAGMQLTGDGRADAKGDAGTGGWTASGNCWGCHQLCGMRVRVEDGRAVQLRGVDGHPRGSAGPGRDGTLCSKAYAQLEKAYDPDRIKEPHVRKDGKLQQVSWEEAWQEAADRLAAFKEEHGPEKMLMMEGYDTSDLWKTLIMHAWGCPNKVGHKTICHGPWSYTWDWMGGVGRPYPDYKNSKYIIAWGRNPMESFNGQWQPKGILDAIEENDATLVTVDPRYTKTAQHSDAWLPIEPRTDGALALAMGHVIVEEGLYDEAFVEDWTYGFERYREAVADTTPEWAAEKTGIDASTIRDVANGFAKAAPNCAAIIWTGITNQSNGHKNAQAIHALNGLVGNLDRPGGPRYWQSPVDLADPHEVRGIEVPRNDKGRPQPLADYEEYPFHHVRGLAHSIMPKGVENGDIAGAFMYWFSPLKNSNTDDWQRALDEMDLVISIDAYWDGAAKKSDIVFPESSQLEKPMLGAGGPGSYPTRGWITGSKAAIEPQWNTKPGFDILKGLAEAMGLGDLVPWKTKEEKLNDALSGAGLTLDELDERNYVLGGEYGYESWKDGGFDTPSGKFQFVLDNVEGYVDAAEQAGMSTGVEYHEPGRYGQVTDETYPLEFTDTFVEQISRAGDQSSDYSREQLAERWGLASKAYRGNYLLVNPRDATPRGIADGDMVTVESRAGSIELMAHVTEGIRPGFVTTTLGWGEGSIAPDDAGGNSMKLHDADLIEPVSGMVARHIPVAVSKGGDA
ncbi:molybdopterin-dependent oxidoreductase [Halobacteriaceae archaeon GCM10025711]